MVAKAQSMSQYYGELYGYDAAGNMTTIPRPAEPTGDFTTVYDAWNRLVALKGLGNTVVGRYEYDGLTRRVVKHTFPGWEELEAADWDAMTQEDWNGLQLTQAHRRDYYYNAGWQILEERVENDSAFDRQYVWGLRYIDGLVFRDRQLTSSVERNYALQDANWNVTALSDDNGAVVERYSYSAYGVPSFLNPDFTPAANNEAYDWDVLYAGYKWDAESSLYLVRYRPLQPLLGCWVTRDPIGYEADDLNTMRYTSNNAVSETDMYGLRKGPLDWKKINAVREATKLHINQMLIGMIGYRNKYSKYAFYSVSKMPNVVHSLLVQLVQIGNVFIVKGLPAWGKVIRHNRPTVYFRTGVIQNQIDVVFHEMMHVYNYYNDWLMTAFSARRDEGDAYYIQYATGIFSRSISQFEDMLRSKSRYEIDSKHTLLEKDFQAYFTKNGYPFFVNDVQRYPNETSNDAVTEDDEERVRGKLGLDLRCATLLPEFNKILKEKNSCCLFKCK